MMSAEDFRISVVVPTYNVGAYIERAIDSILNQTSPPDEVIVVDAESTDDTLEKLQKYGTRLKIIRQKKSGISAGRNDGIKAAKFAWIAFLDGDDQWKPQFLEKQLCLLRRNKDLVWSGTNFIRHNCYDGSFKLGVNPNKARKLLAGKEYFENYFKACAAGVRCQTGGYIIKRQILEQVGMFNVELVVAEDIDLFFRIAYRWPKFGYINEPLTVYYNYRPGGVTQQYKKTDILLKLVDRHQKIAADYGCEKDFKPIASRIVQGWIRAALKDNRIFELRPIISKYRHFLTLSERVRLCWLILIPHVTWMWFHLKSKMKKSAVN